MFLSKLAGSVSLACWIIVFTPQIYENYRRKSADGLSLAFVTIWLAGDIFNVLGSVIQKVLPSMILLAVYYTLADILLLVQCLYYRNRVGEARDVKPLHIHTNILIVLTVVACGALGCLVLPDSKGLDSEFDILGQIFGWICAVLYLCSRMPQLYLNYRRKSTDGVNVLFFVFTLLGNITYCMSIFLAGNATPRALLVNLSWIVGAFGSLLMDLAVLAQFHMYKSKSVELP